MILLIQVFIVIGAGIALSMFVREDPGYVLIGHGNYSIETSLAIFGVAALIAIFASYFLIRLLGAVVYAPSRLGKWQDHRREKVAATALSRGLLAQAEGKWRQSEKALLTYAKKTESPINYLAAAKSAQAQGSIERMNQYLDMAQATAPNASTAIRLTQAELLIDSGQYDRATAALLRIRDEAPKNNRALLLMSKLFRKSENWSKLSELLYHMKRNKTLQYDVYNELEKTVHVNLLKATCETGKLIEVRNAWSVVPRSLQRDSELIAIFAKKLISEGEHIEAEHLIRSGVRQHWSDELVYLYGLLYTNNPYDELSVAEKWYKKEPNNPTLLLTLGRLSSRSALWGKASSYLESSVENGGGPESYHALAQVLEHIDEPEMAASMYRKGLEIASGKGLPELAALTAKKKAKQEALAKKEAEGAEEVQEEIKALEDKSNDKGVTASAA